MEKNPGGQNFGNEGEGRFCEILSCRPLKCVLPLKCPPQIPRPGAATVNNDPLVLIQLCISTESVLFFLNLNLLLYLLIIIIISLSF